MTLPKHRLALALAALAACTACGLDYFAPDAASLPDDSGRPDSSGGGDDSRPADDSQPADDSVPQGQGPAVDYLSPGYGSAAGGTLVQIIGGPFDDATVVRFGETPATLTARDASTLTARTPAGADGPADVTVTNAEGATTLPGAFYYFEDGTGLAGAYGELYWVDYQGGYWNNPVDFGGAAFSLIVAQDLHYWELYAPAEDTCRSEYTFPGEIYVYDLEVPATTLTTGNTSVNLTWDAQRLQWSTATDLLRPQFVNNATYDLRALGAGIIPDLAISPLLTTPRDFAVTGPSQLTGQNLQNITRSQLNFSWSSADAHAMILQLGVTNAAGDAFDEWVTCWARNDGSFTVPSSVFTRWTPGRYVYVYVGAVVESGGRLPTNGAESRVAGVHFKLYAGATN